jgi:UDP-N-acetylmuramate: L-alanyl-gamma-D-glutamyl-meso-diaminopimelate ligase
VKTQFPGRKLIAVLELHTYSSLQAAFMREYRGVLDPADSALVYYSAHALELKRLPPLDPETVKAGFGNPGLAVLSSAQELSGWLKKQNYDNSNLLLMSSGNFDGLDIPTFVKEITE